MNKTITYLLIATMMIYGVIASPSVNFVYPTPDNYAYLDEGEAYTINYTTEDTVEHYSFLNNDDDVLLWYTFDYNQTTTYFDSSSYGNDCTLGQPAYAEVEQNSKYSNATKFAQGVINRCALESSPVVYGNYTLSAWLYTDNDNINTGYFFAGTTINPPYSSFRLDTDNSPDLLYFRSAIGTFYNWDTGADSLANNWFHVVYRANYTDMEVFLNGVSLGAIPVDETNHTIYAFGSTANTINITMDDFVFINRYVSDNEIQMLYNASKYNYTEDFSLTGGEDTITANARNIDGQGDSDSRQLGGGTFSVTYPDTNYTFQRVNNNQGYVKVVIENSGVNNFAYNYSATGPEEKSGSSTLIPITDFSRIVLPVGVWDLYIYDLDNLMTFNIIKSVRVGDIWMVGGQSNAGGFHDENLTADINYAETLEKYPVKNYHVGNEANPEGWRDAPDYAWKLLFLNVSIDADIPISYINPYHNGAAVTSWFNDSSGFFEYDTGKIRNMTNGTMNIAGIMWIHGESDADGSQTYEQLIQNHTVLTGYYQAALNMYMVSGMIYQQVNKAADNNADHDKSRRAQAYLWENNPNVFRGFPTYDINVNSSGDDVHYRLLDEWNAVLSRWDKTLKHYVYSTSEDWRGPIIQSIVLYDNDTIRVTYDETISSITNFQGVEGTDAIGWRISDGVTVLNNSQGQEGGVTSARAISDTVIEINLSQNVNVTSWTLSWANQLDSYNQTVLRDAVGLPPEVVWNLSLNYLITTETTDANLEYNTALDNTTRSLSKFTLLFGIISGVLVVFILVKGLLQGDLDLDDFVQIMFILLVTGVAFAVLYSLLGGL